MFKVDRDTYQVEIDLDMCCQCGRCVGICGCGVLEMGENGPIFKNAEQCIGCTHCTAVCPTRAIHAIKRPGAPAEQPAPVPTEDFGDKPTFLPLEELSRHISARRSVRDFKPEAPSREVLNSIIQAARYAPTACNYRKVKYAVITDPEHIKTLREMCMKMYPMPRVLLPAPALLLVINELTKEMPDDATIAATTVDLVARSVGVACTFAGIVRRCIAGSEEIRNYLRDACGITGLSEHPVQAMYLGYPADDKVEFLRPAVRGEAPITWA